MDKPSELPDGKFFKQTIKLAHNFCDCFMTRIVDGSTTQFWNYNWRHGFLSTVFTELYREAKDSNLSYPQVLHTQDKMDLFYNGTTDDFRREWVQMESLLASKAHHNAG